MSVGASSDVVWLVHGSVVSVLLRSFCLFELFVRVSAIVAPVLLLLLVGVLSC